MGARARARAVGVALVGALGLTAGGAAAQDPADLPSTPSPPAFSRGLDAGQKIPYWYGSGPTRFFVSSVLELGAIYARPQLAVGYGRPHWAWVGLETYSSVSAGGGGEYGGLRFAFPAFELRAGVDYTFTFGRYFLVPREEYTRNDVEKEQGPKSRYLSLEGGIAGGVKALHGEFVGVLDLSYVTGVPAGYYAFDESLHVVLVPPYVWRARGGYLGHFGRDEGLRVGAAAEVIGVPERAQGAYTVRAGPVFGLTITHHLDAVGAFMIPLYGPDELGLTGAETGQLGFRYRFATGDRWAEFP